MSTPNGKIARLPKAIREQLNHRLADGEFGKTILEWLNALPEVRKILAEQFAGEPISPQNLSNWRSGGHQHWLKQQERLALVRQLAEDVKELAEETDGAAINGHFAAVLAADFAATAMEVLAAITDPVEKCKRMQEILLTLSRNRHQDFLAGRLKIEEERRELERQNEAVKAEHCRELAPLLQEIRISRMTELFSKPDLTSQGLAFEQAISLFNDVAKARDAVPDSFYRFEKAVKMNQG